MMMVKTMTIVSFVTAFPETPPQKLINILSRLAFLLRSSDDQNERKEAQIRDDANATPPRSSASSSSSSSSEEREKERELGLMRFLWMRVFVMMSKSHKTTNERERERKKGKQKSEKKADGNARLKRHTNRQLVKEFISVFEKFLHFFPSLRLM